MESGKLGIFIQAAMAASIIVGLALVILELRQVQTLARAQLTSDAVATNNSIHTAMLGESAAEVVEKACLKPESLTLRDSVILDAYYFANANILARLALHTDRDGVYPEGYWQENMFYLYPILNSHYGREWLTDLQSGWPPGFLDAVHATIDQLGPPRCESSHLDRIQRMKEGEKSGDA